MVELLLVFRVFFHITQTVTMIEIPLFHKDCIQIEVIYLLCRSKQKIAFKRI